MKRDHLFVCMTCCVFEFLVFSSKCASVCMSFYVVVRSVFTEYHHEVACTHDLICMHKCLGYIIYISGSL